MSSMFGNLLRQYKQSFIHFLFTNYPQLLSDKYYLTIMYRYSLGEEIDWKNPKKFTEKLQWLKLHDRNPLYTTLVDKYAVKQYVSKVLGPEYVIPTLGIYDKFEDIDFDKLPDSFVIKCTHDSGSYVICNNKNELNIEKARKRITSALHSSHFNKFREWPYKNVKPRIIVEKNISGGFDLVDYKFFCFWGEPKIMYISNDAVLQPKTDFFDMKYNHLNMKMKDENSLVPPSKPAQFEKMKDMATLLSRNIPHVRVDFYVMDDRVFFGEMTFYHNAGFQKIYPKEWNEILGSWLKL